MREDKAAKDKEQKQAARVLEQIEAVSNYIILEVLYYQIMDPLNVEKMEQS